MTFLPDTFLSSFARPLVEGGDLHVGLPLDLGDLEALVAEVQSPGDMTVHVEALRAASAGAFWIFPIAAALDKNSLRLLVGLHNILFLSHPEVASWTVRHHRLQDLVAFTQWCLNVPVPLDEAELVARHTILANLTALTRTDVEVRFWVGHRRFLGQEPPRRLLRWPKVRRISRREEQVGWLASGTLSEDQDALLNALFHASPLTALLTVTRAAPGLRWEPLLPYLMRPRVCRVVAHAYLAEGLSRVGPPIARSFWEIVSGLEAGDVDGGPERRQRSQATLRFLADLVYYLYACECLVDAPTEGSFLPKGGEAIESLLSILVSAFHVNLLQSPSRLAEPAVAGRLNQLIATGREALSTDTTNALSASLQDALS